MKNKKIFVALLAALCICGTAGSMADCIDQTTDNNDSQILAVYNSYVANAEADGTDPLSYEDWLALIKGEKGDKGDDGLTPYIGENGNWWIGTTDTGVKAEGKDGADGKDGTDGTNGTNGTNGKDGTDGIDGTDGEDGVYELTVKEVSGDKEEVDVPSDSANDDAVVEEKSEETTGEEKI